MPAQRLSPLLSQTWPLARPSLPAALEWPPAGRGLVARALAQRRCRHLQQAGRAGDYLCTAVHAAAHCCLLSCQQVAALARAATALAAAGRLLQSGALALALVDASTSRVPRVEQVIAPAEPLTCFFLASRAYFFFRASSAADDMLISEV